MSVGVSVRPSKITIIPHIRFLFDVHCIESVFLFGDLLLQFVHVRSGVVNVAKAIAAVDRVVRQSVPLSVIDYFPGCIFVTDGRRDLGIGLYERFWPVDELFDSFGQVRPGFVHALYQDIKIH